MKKILFVLPYYKIGGTLTSFSNLIPLIDKNEYEISAFALTSDIDDISALPKNVIYLGLESSESSQKALKKGTKKILRWCKRTMTKFGYDPSDVVFKRMAQSLSGKYDVVISFQEGQATRMTQYIQAPKKIAWIHCMYSRFKEINKSCMVEAYNNFDKIVCVSNTAAEDMIECEPRWSDKIHVVYNAIDNALICAKALDGIAYKKNVNLISVGRIDPVKRFSYIPEIARVLKDDGLDFDWWIIGGPVVQGEYTKLLKNIKLYQVDDCVHSLGAVSNPYPYIKSSTLLICLSRSETFNYTIAEAKALGVPAVSTNFASAYEFINHENTGLILSIGDIANGIKRILADKQLYSHIKNSIEYSPSIASITKEQFRSLLENE